MNQPEALSTDVIYDLAISRLERQVRQIEGVDTKLNFAFSVSSLIIGIAVSLFLGFAPEVTTLSKVFFAAGTLAYVTIVVFSILGYRFLALDYPPNVHQVWLDALYWEPEITKRQVLAQIVEAIEANKGIIDGKIFKAQIALYLVAAEVIFVISTEASLIF